MSILHLILYVNYGIILYLQIALILWLDKNVYNIIFYVISIIKIIFMVYIQNK